MSTDSTIPDMGETGVAPESRIPKAERYEPPFPAAAPRRPLPVATLVIVALCAGVFVLQTLAGGSKNPDVLLDFGASYKTYFLQGQYWRAVMPLFLHVGWWHLAMNMLSLLVIGPVLERIYGYGRFAVIYLGAGICGSLLSMFHGHAIAAGASGAIFGVAGAIVVAGWVHRDALPYDLARIFRHGRFTFILLVLIVMQLAAGYLVSNIDNWGHLGGLVGGAVLAFLIAPRRLVVALQMPGWKPALAEVPIPVDASVATEGRASQGIVLLPVAVVALAMAGAANHYRVAHQVSTLLEQAERLELRNQPGQAFDRYRRAQQLDPRDERPAVALGRLELEQHDAARAIADFSRALQLDPESLQARFGLAEGYRASGNAAAAQKVLEAVASQYPKAADVQEMLADLLAEQKRYPQAIERYQTVLRLSPGSPLAHNNLAWLYATADDARFRNPAAALDHARKAVELSRWQAPDFIDTLAEAFYANKQYAEAVKVQSKALELAPDNREFQEHMARYRSAAGG